MRFPASGEVPRHLAVFDCNVYLDAAQLVGPPFSWEKFSAAVARLAKEPFPHPDAVMDSLRALAVCTSGRFANVEALEVWTCANIDMIVRSKAQQPVVPDPSTGDRGLGWTPDDALDLVDELVYGLVERSDGGTLGDCVPDGNPPLDHEDGKVYGACRTLAGDDPLANVYCITRDRGFIEAYSTGKLRGHTRVITPSQFVGLTRAARAQFSMSQMARRS